MMKSIPSVLVFVALKLVEISAVVFIPWGVGLLAKMATPYGTPFVGSMIHHAPVWPVGVYVIAIPVLSIAVIFGIGITVFDLNLALTRRIVSRFRKTGESA